MTVTEIARTLTPEHAITQLQGETPAQLQGRRRTTPRVRSTEEAARLSREMKPRSEERGRGKRMFSKKTKAKENERSDKHLKAYENGLEDTPDDRRHKRKRCLGSQGGGLQPRRAPAAQTGSCSGGTAKAQRGADAFPADSQDSPQKRQKTNVWKGLASC